MTLALQAWRALFRELRPDTDMALAGVFDASIVFEDPLHHIEGIDALDAYFTRLNRALHVCRFEYGEAIQDGARAAITGSLCPPGDRSRTGPTAGGGTEWFSG